MIHHAQYRSGLKWDKLCNWLATDIIAISENVRKILINLERVPTKKIHIINHGFELGYFMNVSRSRTGVLKQKYHIKDEFFPIVGVIARYTKWKGIEFVIESFKNVQHLQPNAHLILANATGDYAPVIKQLLSTLPEGSFTEIAFEDDLAALYNIFDVFVHVPPDPNGEAFGQTYIEALAAGVPSVFTLSGIASEFIVHKQNALVVNFQNADEISDAIQTICSDASVRRSLVRNGRSSVSAFSIHIMLDKLIDLYG
jgi:glycosyltransferase involved in cell wall biosynthesis